MHLMEKNCCCSTLWNTRNRFSSLQRKVYF